MRIVLWLVATFFSIFHANAEGQLTIGIFTYSVPGGTTWDPDSVKGGITGSEEAVVYMSQHLAQLGCKVIVYANPPQDSPHSLPAANPRFVKLDFDDGTQFDIGISWRQVDAAKRIRQKAKKVYLWPHDAYVWTLPEPYINSFDGVLWVSKWQREQWSSVNPGFAKFTEIFGNGINPDQFSPVQERENPYSCIYGSNYARGLETLLDQWPEIKEKFPKATLDIYYGWQHWGLLSKETEKKMRKQIKKLGKSGVTDHGLVGHEELNKAYAKASFWTYPCMMPMAETFCITALRAQLSGAVPVVADMPGLKETVRHGYKSAATPQAYLATLLKAMGEVDKITLEDRKKMGEFILKEYTWRIMAEKWKAAFIGSQ